MTRIAMAEAIALGLSPTGYRRAMSGAAAGGNAKVG